MAHYKSLKMIKVERKSIQNIQPTEHEHGLEGKHIKFTDRNYFQRINHIKMITNKMHSFCLE